MDNILKTRITYYFQEAYKYIDKIQKANKVLKEIMPINITTLENLSKQQQDKLYILAFKFSKLQDLLGDKIFGNSIVVLMCNNLL